MTTLQKLPYVDGLPDEGQERINWIENGERLMGAEHRYGNDGNLNLAGTQIQKNIVALYENSTASDVVLIDQQKQIDHLKEILNESSDVSLILRVNEHTDQIEIINDEIDAQKAINSVVSNNISEIITTIGTSSSLENSRPIYTEIDYLKSVVGNKKDENANGGIEIGKEATGIQKRLDDVNMQAVTNKNDIEKLKGDLDDFELPAIQNDITEFRIELGTKPVPFVNPIYTRLTELETSSESFETKIETIEQSIGSGSVTKRLSDLETFEISADLRLDKLESDTTELKTNQGTIQSDINALKLSDQQMIGIVGSSVSVGLQGDVAKLKIAIGDETTPEPTSLRGRVTTLENTATTNTAKIQDLELSVGNGSSGLIKQANDSTKAINGDSSKTDPVEKAGLMATTKTLYANSSTLTTAVNELYNKMNHNQKKFSLLTDKTLTQSNNLHKVIASRLNSLDGQSVYSLNGVDGILLNSNLTESLKSNVILINVGTSDYLHNTTLGAIEDASDDYSGSANFYNSVYKLLKSVVVIPEQPRVFITTGYVSGTFTGSDVVFPAPNASGKTLEDYSKAIFEVAKIFRIPVIDTLNLMGVSATNAQYYTSPTGLNSVGLTRFSNICSGQINSL